MRRYLVLGMLVLGAAVGYGASLTQPTVYASTSTLMVVPARVPDAFVPGSVAAMDPGRIIRLQKTLLTRTRAERIIADLNLYAEESKTRSADAIVQLMRDSVVMQQEGDTVRVGFIHADAQVAQRVAERLAALMVDANLRERELQAENANQFIDSQMDEVRRRLNDAHAQLPEQRRAGVSLRSLELDIEVLEARYRELSRMSEEAKVAANLERRQIGEQVRIIDAARLPEQPMPRGRHASTAIGAGIGLLAGLGIAFRRPRARR